jgi:ring-1,2-phenylacetyl-CoA epoxidase subunit PaaC
VTGAADRDVVLAFADDEHLMGQRHTEWIGVAPFLEEDLAFSSIAQDELGHAVSLYELLIDPSADVDAFVFGREPVGWRSCALVEEPCTDWADALVRHWLYDSAEELRWRALSDSVHGGVRAAAARALQEEQYHVRHADALVDALVDDPEAYERLTRALERLLPLAVAMFDDPIGELLDPWRAKVDARFGAQPWATITVDSDVRDRATRSEHFDEVYARMREVVNLDPTARW